MDEAHDPTDPIRILVVEDEPSARRAMSDLLCQAGYRVAEAGTADTALKLAREHRPHLVFLNVVLPDLNGLEVCRMLKADPCLSDVSVILMSREPFGADNPQSGLEAGADDYMPCPASARQVLARVRTNLASRKRAEQAQRRFEAIVAAVRDPIAFVDRDYIYRVVNPAYSDYAKLSREEIVGKTVAELLGQAVFGRTVRPHLDRCFSGEEVHCQSWFDVPEEPSRFMDVAYYPVFDEGGTVTGAAVASRDMTEHKNILSALQRERKLLSRIMETSPVGIVIFDMQGRITFANPLVCEISGLSQNELVRQTYDSPVWRLLDEDGAPLPVEALPFVEVARTRSVVRNVRLGAELPDGRRMSLSVSAAPMFGGSGDLDGVVVTVEDITVQVQAENRLRQSEERYRDLVENVSDVIYVLDQTGLLTYVSPSVESLLGYRPDKMIGQPFYRYVVADDLERITANYQRLLSGAELGASEYGLVSASGETRWVRASSQPILEEGKVVGVRGMLTDFSDQRLREEKGQEAAAAAERARLARDLHDAVTQTLFSVSAIAEALPRVWKRDPDEAQRGLEELRWLARAALAEMRALLLELRPSAVTEQDLGTLVTQLIEATMGRTRTRVMSEIEGSCTLPPRVQMGLYRIVQEALSNVAKHARSRQLFVRLACRPHRVLMTVRDDGRGFDPDALGAHHMGLAIIRERAQAIGAQFDLQTAPGQGTEITVVWERDTVAGEAD